MASTISTTDSVMAKLAPTFQTAIKTIIDSESDPLKRAQTKRDEIDVRKGIYTDAKTNLDGLQSALQALISTQASYSLVAVSKSSVAAATSGTTVMTATSSETAPLGEYDVVVTQLAKAQSRLGAAVTSSDIALGKSGTFWLGGTGTASLQTETGAPGVYTTFAASSAVTGTTLGTVATGQRELGTGNYAVQVRDSDGVRQFRLVNADGTAMSIRNTSGSGYSSGWQSVSTGEFDTGRGLKFTLNLAGEVGSTVTPYTAKGTSISISTSDTQRNIMTAINAAVQPEGRDFKASIVANQLVFTGLQTGENHGMLYSDGAGLGISTTDLQTAQNAKFTVNGMQVSRATNSNMTDVMDGVTLNLAADAEGKAAHLSITGSSDKAVGLMNAMVSKFNAAISHLSSKLGSTSKTENGKTTYTRGPLTGDTVFSSLRNDLLIHMNRSVSNTGSFSRLSDIGLSFDKDLKLTFDSTKFSDALKNHASDLTAILDASLGNVNSLVSRYAGTSGTLSRNLKSIDDQRTSYDRRVTKYTEALNARKKALIDQYLGYQSQLADLGRSAEMFGLATTSTTSSSVNLLG